VKFGVLLLGGPTAAGKSALAIELAERFDAEIVSADSRQIYAGMPIGTALPSAQQRARVAHHLLEFLDPAERYSAARFSADASSAIAAIHGRGKRAIVAGGTGFYLRALAGDVALSPSYHPALRARLARETKLHPPEFLHAWLALRDPQRAAAIAVTDPYRIARALEIALGAAREAAPLRAQHSLRSGGIDFLKVWLDVPFERLDERIERRVGAMLADGFVEEAERIGAQACAADAVGYPLALAYARGWITHGELRAGLLRATRRYAKRQRTWFRGEPSAIRIEAGDPAAAREAIMLLAKERLGWN
jgi:tRNA dimethylallyltransferase